jgi:hypothetical protein
MRCATSQAARGLHHEQREVAAAAGAAGQRLGGRLGAFLLAPHVFEAVLDRMRHVAEQVQRGKAQARG